MRSPSGWAERGQRPESAEFTIVLQETLAVQTHDGQLAVQATGCALPAADEDVAGGPALRYGASTSHALSYDIKEVDMTDMLIRDVPDDVIAALDAHAGRLGLSRSEYVRRRLAQDAAQPGSPVSVQDLARFTEVFGDLADPDVMSQAWR